MRGKPIPESTKAEAVARVLALIQQGSSKHGAIRQIRHEYGIAHGSLAGYVSKHQTSLATPPPAPIPVEQIQRARFRVVITAEQLMRLLGRDPTKCEMRVKFRAETAPGVIDIIEVEYEE